MDIDSKTIVLVEGMLLFKNELNQYFDYKVFLDVSGTEILKRGKQRDVPKFGLGILQKYRERYIPVYHRYLEIDKPITSAHMVIDNNNIEDPIILKK
ncbi:nucleoside/nucleotide kinase family protein [Pediococcus argentinicus]|uniref:Uridine kinase n=1 Tax=Pediococcus argentinicus TaxID=480391 RepID=A0A0R2NCV1_9LACO|nr:hypothetical protein [Pediococcus argentinicus]KRO23670.1 hypothetical protein IV88_GL000879 [Pediococcus argentinicus]NKZ22844.1 hypothetical protein [Pediococcus argentinicus]